MSMILYLHQIQDFNAILKSTLLNFRWIIIYYKSKIESSKDNLIILVNTIRISITKKFKAFHMNNCKMQLLKQNNTFSQLITF